MKCPEIELCPLKVAIEVFADGSAQRIRKCDNRARKLGEQKYSVDIGSMHEKKQSQK